jgi:hypothetical protein
MDQPSDLQNKIKTLQEKLPSLLDDFKKYYVNVNKNPTYTDYQTHYQNIKANITSTANDLLTIFGDVTKNSQNISNGLSEINVLIESEKQKNAELTSIQNGVDNNYNGSKIMIDEYKELYNKNYMKNILMVVGIIGAGIALVKVFGNKNAASTNLPAMNK